MSTEVKSKVQQISEISRDTNYLRRDLQQWIRDGQKLKDRIGEIDSKLLEIFRREVAK